MTFTISDIWNLTLYDGYSIASCQKVYPRRNAPLIRTWDTTSSETCCKGGYQIETQRWSGWLDHKWRKAEGGQVGQDSLKRLSVRLEALFNAFFSRIGTIFGRWRVRGDGDGGEILKSRPNDDCVPPAPIGPKQAWAHFHILARQRKADAVC